MLSKPSGFLTSMSDPVRAPVRIELVLRAVSRAVSGRTPGPRHHRPAIFSTDGNLGQGLLHPSRHVWKTYWALCDGRVRDAELDALRQGIELDDGPCQPARCRILDAREVAGVWTRGLPDFTTPVEVRIREGRKNQVKRMLGRIHHPVIRLHRVRFGALGLGTLQVGEWRILNDDEIGLLRAQE